MLRYILPRDVPYVRITCTLDLMYLISNISICLASSSHVRDHSHVRTFHYLSSYPLLTCLVSTIISISQKRIIHNYGNEHHKITSQDSIPDVIELIQIYQPYVRYVRSSCTPSQLMYLITSSSIVCSFVITSIILSF